MKLIIAGSRTIDVSPTFIHGILEYHLLCDKFGGYIVKELVCGSARGVDTSGEYWADWAHIPIKLFPADWESHGKAAGVIRNKHMAEYADALLLIWDGKSKGSSNMKKQMTDLGKPIYEVILK